MELPIDVEAAMVEWLESLGYEASAPPLPERFGLPSVHVVRVGGARTAMVRDEHDLSVDVRAKTWAEATEVADEIMAAVCDLQGGWLGGVPVYDAVPTALPYENQDPAHPDIPRVTFPATVAVRALHRD